MQRSLTSSPPLAPEPTGTVNDIRIVRLVSSSLQLELYSTHHAHNDQFFVWKQNEESKNKEQKKGSEGEEKKRKEKMEETEDVLGSFKMAPRSAGKSAPAGG